MVEYEQQQVPQGFVPITRKDNNFLQWFLSLNQGITDLKLTWRGWERDNNGNWVKPTNSDDFRIMNEKGIQWAVGLMNSYLTKNSQATNWDADHMAFQMRVAARVIWNTLEVRWREFQLTKTNASVVGDTIFYQIHSILLAARGEGIRKFIQTTQSVSEHRVLDGNQRQGGMFQGIKGLFGGNS